MATTAHRCWQCGELYPRTVDYFRPKRINSDGLAGNCRHCTNANRRKARAEKKAARLVIKPTAAQRHKAYRQRKKAERFAQITGVIQHGQP
jgi:hypothetical protein